jgi:hypothetical protein
MSFPKVKYTQLDIEAQERHISHLRMMELVVEKGGDPEKIARAKASYESAVEGLHMMLDEIERRR